jgi:hypothetical protein
MDMQDYEKDYQLDDEYGLPQLRDEIIGAFNELEEILSEKRRPKKDMNAVIANWLRMAEEVELESEH